MQEINKTSPETSRTAYRYVDGSGNSYRLSSEVAGPISFSYSPIKPEFSSSGTYDGGDPVKKDMTGEQFAEIQELFEKCLETRDGALKDRPMGSGQISSYIDGESRVITLSMRDSRNMAIGRWLRDFKE